MSTTSGYLAELDFIAHNNQVALNNSFRNNNSSSYPSKVPMFLQKLYTILEDTTTNDVISWSEDGFSFYVHDQDALAKKHLPHWFKHNKFASFVRQLNMYGFHKIPHLQQGLITGVEISQFSHPYFQRGREDQLIFIERKKQTKDQVQLVGFDTASDPLLDGATAAGAGLGPVPGGASTLDASTILSALQAIRRSQAQISKELSDLKEADRVLWDEAQKSRERYEQQQETINRIVKFLASFISQLGSGHVTTQQPHYAHSQQDVPQQDEEHERPVHSRLMIEDRDRSGRGASPRPMGVQPTSVETPGSRFPSPTSPTMSSVPTSSPLPNRAFSSPTPPPFPSPTLTNALSNISPADWAKVLGSFSTDFLASSGGSTPKLVTSMSMSVPEGLIPFDVHCAPSDLDKIGQSVDDMNGDIASLSSMLGLSDPLFDAGGVVDISARSSPVPVDNLKGVPFELSPPPPPRAAKRKSEGGGGGEPAEKVQRRK